MSDVIVWGMDPFCVYLFGVGCHDSAWCFVYAVPNVVRYVYVSTVHLGLAWC